MPKSSKAKLTRQQHERNREGTANLVLASKISVDAVRAAAQSEWKKSSSWKEEQSPEEQLAELLQNNRGTLLFSQKADAS